MQRSIITKLLAREQDQDGSIDLWGFYARRVKRLLPAALVMLMATLTVGAFLLEPMLGEVQGLAWSAVNTLFFQANHFFWHATEGYFADPVIESPLLHMWSLAVEEQFYLFWPVLLLFLGRFRAHGMRIVGIGLLGLASFSFAAWFLKVDAGGTFYSAPTRAWELAMGALLALVSERRYTISQSSCSWMSFSGLVLVVVAVVTYTDRTPFPGVSALPPVLGTALVPEQA